MRTCLFAADSQPVFLRGIASVLSQRDDLAIVGTALTWEEATREVAELAPNVAMIEDSLAGSCTAALAALDALGLAPRVVFVADSVETASIYDAVAGGAAGYLTRRASPDLIVSVLRGAFCGQTAITPDLQARLANEIRARAVGPAVQLSIREQRTLQLVADGLKTNEIASLLAVSRATVRREVSATLAKLGVGNRTAAVAEGFRQGLLS